MISEKTMRRFDDARWNSLDLTKKLFAIQCLVDEYLPKQVFGCQYEVKLVNFNDKTRARFVPENNTIELSRKLVDLGEIELSKNMTQKLKYASNHVYFLIAHEVKHALQYFEFKNTAYNHMNRKLRSMSNNLHSYFKINFDNAPLADRSVYLYMMQPLEKDAYEFANKEIEEFTKQMHGFYPNNLAYVDSIIYSDFDFCIMNANQKMFSNNTVKDIENIINTIAGEFVEEPLNPFVCHVVEQTQNPEFHKMLVKQAAINNTIIEKEQKNLFDKEKDIMVDESLWESVEFEK